VLSTAAVAVASRASPLQQHVDIPDHAVAVPTHGTMQFLFDHLLERGVPPRSLSRAHLLLDSLWAAVTQRNYASRWLLFAGQCATIDADPFIIDAIFLADWLAESSCSAGMARSVAVAVSSIRYFVEANFPASPTPSSSPPLRLGEHPAVVQVLRAIDRSRGRTVARVAQTWDLQLLLQWLRSSFEALDSCSHLLLRTRLLILLRIAFLLRSVDVEKLALSAISFTLDERTPLSPHLLQPDHVPRLSAVTISIHEPKGAAVAGLKGTISPPATCARHSELALCPVRHMAAYFLRFFLPRCGTDVSRWRRTGLLLHLSSQAPLHSQSFSACVRHTLGLLGIDAKARSLRAVVASTLFDQDLSLDQIRLLGGWRSVSTVESHYIRSKSAATLRLRTFTPAVSDLASDTSLLVRRPPSALCSVTSPSSSSPPSPLSPSTFVSRAEQDDSFSF